jgi:hypothetical protein
MDSLQSRSTNPTHTLTIDASGESNLDRKSLRDILIELIAELDTHNDRGSSISAAGYCIDKLRLRDLRRLDPTAGFAEETSIISRKHAVLFTMNPVKAIVTAQKLVLFVPDGADTLLEKLPALINAYLAEGSTSNGFECIAYDALLRTFFELENESLFYLAKQVSTLINDYYRPNKSGSILPYTVQDEMKLHKNHLAIIAQRVSSCRQLLDGLSEDEEEMCLMNLTLLQKQPSYYQIPLAAEIIDAHDNIEELLESHLIDFSTLEKKVLQVQRQIFNAEEAVSTRLDSARNMLYITNAMLTLFACALAVGDNITGLFGMNSNQLLTMDFVYGGFIIVTIMSFVAMLVTVLIGYLYLKYTNILPEKILPGLLRS